jgi:hypothetical protein
MIAFYGVFGDGEWVVIPSFFGDVKNSGHERPNPGW